jgi:hypothetical protein
MYREAPQAEEHRGIPSAPRSRRTTAAEGGRPTRSVLATGRSRRRSRRRDPGSCRTTSCPGRISHRHRTTPRTADPRASSPRDGRSTSFDRTERSCRRTATGTHRGPRLPMPPRHRRGVAHAGCHDQLTAPGVHESEADRERRTRSISPWESIDMPLAWARIQLCTPEQCARRDRLSAQQSWAPPRPPPRL